MSMFGRMGLTVGIGLLVTRLLLRWLGEIDYGLLLALAATGSLLQFLTSALTTSVQRHLAYELGRDDLPQLRRVVSTAWVLFYAVGIGFWIIGQLLAPLVLYLLTIPPDRMNACWWVYQIALLNLVVGVTATPFQAVMVAHQHLTAQAFFESLSMIARLAAVLMLLVVPWDHLIAYSAMQLAGYAVVRWATVTYCCWRFPEARPRWRDFDRTEVHRIVMLTSWTVLGNLSWRMRMQGGTVLLNIFFGPRVNAAYGISIQLAGYVSNFTQAIRLAVLPAIVGAHAQDKRRNVHRLALVTGKYSLLLLSLLFVPIWIAAPQILQLWLGELPPYTIVFARIVLIWALTYIFTIGYRLALLSTGDIGWYARTTFLISVATIVCSALGFYGGLQPWWLPVFECVGVLVLSQVQVFKIGAKIDLPAGRWVREALLPTLGVLLPSIAVAATTYLWWPEGPWQSLAVLLVYGLVAVPLIWWVGLAAWEREKFVQFAWAGLSRLRSRNGPEPGDPR